MRRLTTIAATAALLGGCATGGSDIRPAMCGWIEAYPPALQARAAAELDALPPGAALARLVEDYGALRARIRAACGGG
jgi:hypothetical protein